MNTATLFSAAMLIGTILCLVLSVLLIRDEMRDRKRRRELEKQKQRREAAQRRSQWRPM